MDFPGGLPYDDSVPYDDPPKPASAAADADGDHPMLDRPLDDFIDPAERGPRERGPVPEHVQSLIGRMGQGKVYLAEESPGIIHHDAERRIARDPHLTKLALELDKQDPTAWLDAISETAASRIRPNALFVESDLIKHLSTSKVFTWASEYGAGIMGIEWLNDTSLILLFPSPAAALLSLSMLAKAGFDPTEGDDPLMERAAHQVPPSLLPRAEPELLPADSQAGAELMADVVDDDGTARKGRGAFRAAEPKGSAHGAFDLPALASTETEEAFAEGVDPNARVTVRYAVESDNTRRKKAGESSWYQKHGRGAGKETGPRRGLGGGRWEERGDLKDRVGTSGEGRDFARRIGRERSDRAGPYDRRPRRANKDDLDAELEQMRSGDAEREYSERRRGGRRGGGEGRDGRGGRDGGRGQARQEDLDRELDDLLASRAS